MVKKNTDPCHSFYAITQMKKDKIQKEQGGRKKERHKKEKRKKEKRCFSDHKDLPDFHWCLDEKTLP